MEVPTACTYESLIVILFYFILFYFILFYFILFYFILFYFISFFFFEVLDMNKVLWLYWFQLKCCGDFSKTYFPPLVSFNNFMRKTTYLIDNIYSSEWRKIIVKPYWLSRDLLIRYCVICRWHRINMSALKSKSQFTFDFKTNGAKKYV